MKIRQFSILTEAELLARLKTVRLKGFGGPEVYKKATLELVRQVDTDTLTPPQKYVLSGGVQTILDLAEAFKEYKIDVFSLTGAILFWTREMDPQQENPIPLLPPVVEESIEPDGRLVKLVNDGMHRVFAARKVGCRINIVLAASVPPEFPYYAYALKGGWAEVEEIPELTDGYKKKEYRNPDNYKALFRDFNAVFEGVQKDRKKTNPAELKA